MTVATSFIGARRLTAQNDEALAFDIHVVEEPATKSLQYCENIATKLKNVNHLPAACHKYSSVVSKLEQSVAHEQQGMNVAFAGMSPGQAQRAKNSRLQGRETQAQFQRRMTRSHKMSGNYN